MFPKWLQTTRLDDELTEFTACAQVEAAAVVNTAELPPTGTSEGCTQPAPYKLDDQMDVTEDPTVQDPEVSGVMLTDEQLAEELYGPQTGP